MGECVRGCDGVPRWYRSSHWLYDNPQRFEDKNILMYPMRASCIHVAGTLASDVLEQTKQDTWAVLGWVAHHRLGLLAEVVSRHRVRWSAAQLSNESALQRTTDSTP